MAYIREETDFLKPMGIGKPKKMWISGLDRFSRVR
jgi:hypothetical protein